MDNLKYLEEKYKGSNKVSVAPRKSNNSGDGGFFIGILVLYGLAVLGCSFLAPAASSVTCYMDSKPIYLYQVSSIQENTFGSGATVKSEGTEYQCTSIVVSGRTSAWQYLLAPIGVAIALGENISGGK